MNVLFATLPATGHFHPLVPFARAVAAAGHQVTFAVPASLEAMVKQAGFPVLVAGADWPREFKAEDVAREVSSPAPRGPDLFIGHFAEAQIRDLLPALEGKKPDVIVRDTMTFGAAVVAEKLGIPHATVQVGGGSNLSFLWGAEGFTERVNRLRTLAGLAPENEPRMVMRYLNLAFVPPSYHGGRLAPTTHHFQLATFDASGSETLPGWVDGLAGRNIVYATLGTVFNKMVQPLKTIVEGLRTEPLEVIATVGRDVDPAALGPQPANVHVERYIPQTLILPRCQIAVMHGGYNSAMSALAVGLPMVIVPLAADQPLNAGFCAELGVARVVQLKDLTTDSIRAAVKDVLENPSYRQAAQRFAADAQKLPPMSDAVKRLEQLAREKQPMPARA